MKKSEGFRDGEVTDELPLGVIRPRSIILSLTRPRPELAGKKAEVV